MAGDHNADPDQGDDDQRDGDPAQHGRVHRVRRAGPGGRPRRRCRARARPAANSPTITLPTMRRLAAISPSPGMAVPAMVNTTARRKSSSGFERAPRLGVGQVPAPLVWRGILVRHVHLLAAFEGGRNSRQLYVRAGFGAIDARTRLVAPGGNDFASAPCGRYSGPAFRPGGSRSLEVSPSPVYGARLLSGFGAYKPLAGSNPATSAPVRAYGAANPDVGTLRPAAHHRGPSPRVGR